MHDCIDCILHRQSLASGRLDERTARMYRLDLLRHQGIEFETEYDFKHPGPVPPSLLEYMPGLERVRVH